MNSADTGANNSNKSDQNRRQGKIINPSFQWKYAFSISAMVFLLSSVLSSVLYAVLHQQARARMMYPEAQVGEVATVVFFSALLFAAVTATGVLIWTITATHRICGPLFVLERHFRDLAKGKIPVIRPLRKKDEFKELFGIFTEAVSTIRNDRKDQLEVIDQALKFTRDAEQTDGDDRLQAIKAATRELGTMRVMLAEALGDQTPVDSPMSDCKTHDSFPAPTGAV